MAAAFVLLLVAGSAQAADKMVIATGVDPSFSQFYIAKQGGIFEKNGLDVDVNTGPSGSAMVPFLINDQVNAAFGSDFAGVVNHNVDPKIVAVADGALLVNWESIVGRNIDNLEGLKGKKVGVAKGTGSEMFWAGVVEKYHLNPADYTIVDIEAPEMLAATERGDIDGFAVWEPWPTRTIRGVKGTKILIGSEGIIKSRTFVYMNRGWIEKNPEIAERFMRSLCEANDLIAKDRPKAAALVGKFLNMPPGLAEELMPKLAFDMYWHDESLGVLQASEDLLHKQGKMKGAFDYAGFIYTDLLKKVRPDAVTITKIPPG